ncbi:meiosis-specific kinetochore protein [Sorex araneus]|uniref:meiosis-specific kinetochore protein n=1 Tax=Sorex araneus TaxID=42254 RepID=UPI002433E6CA|nr:meiosis-specific kinetochore protein [Sorex araneus]
MSTAYPRGQCHGRLVTASSQMPLRGWLPIKRQEHCAPLQSSAAGRPPHSSPWPRLDAAPRRLPRALQKSHLARLSRVQGPPELGGGMAVWLRAYTRKKRAGQRLNLTPTPDLSAWAKAEAPPGPGLRGAARGRGRRAGGDPRVSDLKRLTSGLPGAGRDGGLRKISEKAERRCPGGDGSALASPQLRFTRENSLQDAGAREETEENAALLSESETDGLQAHSSLSNSDLVSELSLQDHNSLLNCSTMDSSKESLSSFPSPEVFRGSDYFDWACPKLEEHMLCKNSTLLDTSKAVAIEEAPLFPNLSAILGTTSEDYQKCHKKIVTVTLADQNISPKPKSTSNPESDNAPCEILLAEKPCTLIPEKVKKKKLNSSTSDKKSKGLLTSTPSSQTAALVIDLSSVQRASSEELFPNVSNYVNSNEIVPVSGLQEISSNEISSESSEICCIVRASPGIRQMGNKTLKKKKYSPPKDIPQDIIIKTNGRM